MTVRILLVEDHEATRDQLAGALRGAGFEVVGAPHGGEALRLLEAQPFDVVVSDYRMAPVDGLELLKEVRRSLEVPFILYSAAADADAIFRAGKQGAFTFLEYPFRIEDQLIPTIRESLTAGRRAERGPERRGVDRLIGDSPAMSRLRTTVRRIAPSRASVLIQGETGTGKELVARALHEESGRGRLVAIAVTELSDTVLESELFGHTRGSFTGAVSAHAGLFEQADGGTLFLDEIGDAPPRLQAKLLRVLETAEVRPLGGSGGRKVDVRLVAATHRNLTERVASGEFREDLLFRIRQATLQLPALRERPEDVEPIARHVLSLLAAEARLPEPAPSPEFFACLREQPWKGNVRELRATLQNVLLQWDAETPLSGTDVLSVVSDSLEGGASEDDRLRQTMLDAFRRNGSNQEAARRELGLSRENGAIAGAGWGWMRYPGSGVRLREAP